MMNTMLGGASPPRRGVRPESHGQRPCCGRSQSAAPRQPGSWKAKCFLAMVYPLSAELRSYTKSHPIYKAIPAPWGVTASDQVEEEENGKETRNFDNSLGGNPGGCRSGSI